ncbi:MAG TPA: hypothetical protein VFG30_16035 [Polyangiales bacterium]|nr:hypothetical protein [Polyangiales bacterium]
MNTHYEHVIAKTHSAELRANTYADGIRHSLWHAFLLCVMGFGFTLFGSTSADAQVVTFGPYSDILACDQGVGQAEDQGYQIVRYCYNGADGYDYFDAIFLCCEPSPMKDASSKREEDSSGSK